MSNKALASGKDKENALLYALWNTVGKEDAESFILGGLSGAIMGGGFYAAQMTPYVASKAINKASDKISIYNEIRDNYAKYQKNDNSRNNMLSLIAEGQTFEKGSKAYKRADSLQNKMYSGKNISAREVQSIINEYAKARSKAATQGAERAYNGSDKVSQQISKTATQPIMLEEKNISIKPAEAKIIDDNGNIREVTANHFINTDTQEIYLSDGTTRKLEDTAIQDDNQEKLYKEAAKYDTETANNMIDGYSDTPAYTEAFDYYYQRGASGESFKINGAYSGQIDRIVAQKAFSRGRAIMKNERDAAAISQKNRVVKEATDGKYLTRDYDEDVVKLSKSAETQINVLEEFANKHKTRISVVSTIDGGTSNALYDPEIDTIIVALDAKEGAYIGWAGHELVHRVKALDIESYSQLEKLVLEHLEKDKNFNLDRRVREIQALYKRETKREYTRAEAIEEIVANSVIPALSDRQFVENISQNNKTLAEKIREWIDDFINELKSAVDKISGKIGEIASVKKDITLMENIRNIMDEAFKNTEGIRETQGETSIQMLSLNEYSYDMRTVIKEYLESTDENFINFYKEVQRKTTKKGLEHEVFFLKNDFPSEMYSLIEKILGFSVLDYKISINGESVKHIESRHGINGKQDQSMKNIKDMARMQFVLTNADKVEHGVSANGNLLYDKQYKNADNTYAKVLTFSKKINGTYFVAVASPETAKKTLHIKTAFISKQTKIEDAQEFDVKNPELTSETKLESSSAIKISQEKRSVNSKLSINESESELAQLKEELNASKVRENNLSSTVATQQAIINGLKEQFKITKGHILNRDKIEVLSKKILKEYSSKYDTAKLADNLQSLFDYIANDSAVDWDGVMEVSTAIAKEIISKSQRLNKNLYNQYADMREYFRTQKFNIPEALRSEVGEYYDGWNNFRRQNFGRWNLTNEGMSLDERWNELSSHYPEFFDYDATEADQVMQVVAVLDTIQPYMENQYNLNPDEYAYDLALRIYDEYFNIPEVKTYADKQAQKFAQQRAKLSERWLREKERIKAKNEKTVTELIHAHHEKLNKLQEKYKTAQGETKQYYRDMISRIKEKDREINQTKICTCGAEKQRASENERFKRITIRNPAGLEKKLSRRG